MSLDVHSPSRPGRRRLIRPITSWLTESQSWPTCLLIDDDPALIPKQVRQAFPAPLARVDVARTGADGIDRVRAEPPDVILLDLRLPDQSGLEVYQAIRQIDARIPVIFVTVAKSADAAIEAMQQGAFDYLFKPLDLDQLQAVVGAALEVARRMREPAVVAETLPDPDVDGAIIGTCPAMREVYKAIGRVAGQNVPVLITGESGTGKELVARAIYQHGLRARAPFLTLNCAAIPETLLESELFGHEKGAFTGADRRRIGKFEQCSGGTLFLDEIGDMPLALQAKVLRLLQEQVFERVGGNETIRTDVRLIAATNRDLKAMVGRGEVPAGPVLPAERLHHPPARLARAGRRPAAAGAALRAALQPRAGPGCPRGRPGGDGSPARLLLAGQHPRAAEHPQAGAAPGRRPGPAPGISAPRPAPGRLESTDGEPVPHIRPGTTLSDLEHEAIQQCLFQTGGNRQRTAERLGISTRTLLRKIREYELDDPLRPSTPTVDEIAHTS